ncbi:hypothetical protein JCM10207_006143 [Rhodosporidiobolus poonsookiae]
MLPTRTLVALAAYEPFSPKRRIASVDGFGLVPRSPTTPTSPRYAIPSSPWPENENEGFEPEERAHKYQRGRRRAGGAGNGRWRIALAAVVTTAVVWTAFANGGVDPRGRIRNKVHSALERLHDLTAEPVQGFDKSLVLNYPEPQDTLTSQIKPGVRYIATLSYGGHANQFMAIQNLLYLGKLLNRVVIIPTLTPLHFHETPRDFSQFYDLDRLYHDTKIPAVELSDMKWWNFSAPPPLEPLSCWSILELAAGGRNVNDGSMAVHNIDVKYFPLPKLGRGSEGFNIWFEAVHDFDFDWASRRDWLTKVRKELLPQKPPPEADVKPTIVPLNRHQNLKDGFDPGRTDAPRDDLFCLDTTFFLGSRIFPPAYPSPGVITEEPLRSYEGHGWIQAGQYIRFSAELERLADIYLLELFGVSTMKEIPPFITVHIRRGDFRTARGLTSLDKYTDGVQRVRDKINWRIDHPNDWVGAGKGNEKYVKGIRAERYAVVATTDEKPDSDFVRELKERLGWKVLDHDAMNTTAELGEWYPSMIDAAVLARGSGFVGTEWSTYSYLAGLRVKYWNGGVEEWTPSLA